MWPLKAHYTLWFGSLSGILPYVSIYARTHLQVTATAVGVLYCALPFVVSITKPIACSTADHYHKHSQALLLSQLVTLLSYGLLVVLPFVLTLVPLHLLWYLFCLMALAANTAMGIGISITDFLVMNEVNLIKQNGGDSNYGNFRIWGTVGFGVFGILSGIINEHSVNLPYLLPGLFMFIAIEALDIACIYRFYHIPNSKIYHPDRIPSNEPVNYQISEHNDNQLMDIDVQPYQSITVAAPRVVQPFWNRVGNNLKQTGNTVLATIRQIFRIYYYYPSLLQYTFIVFCFGVLTAFHWSFFFWFLEDIRGQDSLLMGLCIFVNSFLGEIPLFLVAHRIIQWVGPVLSLCISLSAFSLRYLCYGYLLEKQEGRYWDILLIETLQGLTFSLFYTVMTHVAQYYADKCDKIQAREGTVWVMNNKATTSNQPDGSKESIDDQAEGEFESKMNSLRPGQVTMSDTKNIVKPSATMQGLMSACYEGLGLGVGSLIGGFLIDRFGVVTIWRIAGYSSAALVVFNLLIELLKFCRKQQRKNVF